MAKLDLWTIYDHPRDYPDMFVARRYEADGVVTATPDVLAFPTLALARAHFLHRGLFCLTRMDYDDPAIVETWL